MNCKVEVKKKKSKLDELELSYAKKFSNGIKQIQSSVGLQELEEAIGRRGSGYYSTVIDWNKITDKVKSLLESSITEGLLYGAIKELKTIKVNKAINADVANEIIPEIPFSLENPRIASFIKLRAETIGSNIMIETITATEKIAKLSLEKNYSPKQIARLIRNSIGLNERYALAVEKNLSFMISSGVSEVRAITSADAYAERLINSRALTIARTEVMTGVNYGQTEVWNEAFEAGYVNKDNYVKEWSTAFDELVCDICGPLDGTKVNIDDFFDVDGQLLDSPPAHPNCRCLKSLVSKE